MLPPVHQRLRTATGSLAQLPLPLLLHALWEGRHTVLLTLTTADGRQKRLLLREGALQACESNLAAESLCSYLVARGVMEPVLARQVEAAAQAAGVAPEVLLLQKGAMDVGLLERHRQAVTAQRILDCFGAGWVQAEYVLSEAPPMPEAPRLGMLQLLLYGVANFTPLEVVRTHLPEGTRLRRCLPPPPVAASLRPTDREAGVLELLSAPLTAAEVVARSNLSAEEAARRLFALAVLGLVEEAPRTVAAPAAVVQVVRFLRQEQARLEVEAEPDVPPEPHPAAPPPEDAPQGDITGIIPTHRLPPLPGSVPDDADVTAVYEAPPTDVTAVYDAQSLPREALAPGAVDEVLEVAEALPPSRPAPARRRWPLVAAGLGALVAAGGAGWWALSARPAPTARVPAPAAAVPAPAGPLAEPTLRAPAETWVAAPPGARAQPLVPRGLTLSASGMTLPLPAGRPLAAAGRLLAVGNAAAALPRFEAAARATSSAEAWYGAALSLYALERDGEARVALQHALEAGPEHAPSHLLLGFLEQQAAAMSEARAHYERFLEAAPESALAEDVRALLAQLP